MTNGLFTTMLGDTVSLPMNSFAYQPMLEVQVGSQVLPRQVLSGAPYAMTLAPRASVFGMVSEPDYLLNLYNFSGRALSAAGFGTAVYANSMISRAIDATSSSEGWENATLYVRNSNSNGGTAANIAGQGLPPALILQNSYPGNDISGAALYAETNGGPVIRRGELGRGGSSLLGAGQRRHPPGADGRRRGQGRGRMPGAAGSAEHQTQLRPGLHQHRYRLRRVAGRVWLRLRVQDIRSLLHREPR